MQRRRFVGLILATPLLVATACRQATPPHLAPGHSPAPPPASPSATPPVAVSPTRAGATPRPAVTATAPARAASTPPPVADATSATPVPHLTDVAQRTPRDAIAFLRGKLPEYPGSGPASLLGFSASDILETMDTAVIDAVRQERGDDAVQTIYEVIARSVLASLTEQYGDGWVLVPLDAGHGGNQDYYWDPGSEETEALHARGVVATIQRLADAPEYRHVILRLIFNDAIADDFGLPGGINEPKVNQTLMRQVRASMLAQEAAAWNRAHPDPATQLVVHEISVHFNGGAGGALVLHQGDTVAPDLRARSVDFARRYLSHVVPGLNATGLLPTPLRVWGATGLHDDVMMYNPDEGSHRGIDDHGITLRYGMLQGGGYTPYYVDKILKYGLDGDVWK